MARSRRDPRRISGGLRIVQPMKVPQDRAACIVRLLASQYTPPGLQPASVRRIRPTSTSIQPVKWYQNPKQTVNNLELMFCGVNENEEYMPILIAIVVNGVLLLGVFNLLGFEFYTRLLNDIDLVPFFLGIIYLVAAQIMGGMVRATCGLSLLILSVIDLGFSESEDSILQAVIAILGALVMI